MSVLVNKSDTEWHNVNLYKNPNKLLSAYMDSIDNFREGFDIPIFFYNHVLDIENPWLTDHFTLSLRKVLFDSVDNISLLKAIIHSDDLRLRKTVDSSLLAKTEFSSLIPYKNISNYEMAKLRLREISINR